jgi:hypothetical protein
MVVVTEESYSTNHSSSTVGYVPLNHPGVGFFWSDSPGNELSGQPREARSISFHKWDLWQI